MAKTFDFKKFVSSLSLAMLFQYCKHADLHFQLPSDTKLTHDEEFARYFSALDRDKQGEIEVELSDLNELTTGQATTMLLEYATSAGVQFPDTFVDFSQADKSVWFYIHQRPIFDQVFQEYEYQDMTGWKDVTTVKKEINNLEERAKALSATLSEHLYQTKMKGKNCIVRTYTSTNGIYFVAYPEDYSVAELQYGDDLQLSTRLEKPIHRIFFLYEPGTGRLSVRAKGGKPAISDYQRIFNSSVLDHETIPNDRIFDLNTLKLESFSLTAPSEYRVKYGKVKSITLKKRDEKFALTIDVFDESKHDMIEIHEVLTELRLQPEMYVIQEAIVKVQFEKTRVYRSRDSVTVALRWPNSHNLANKPLHNQVKKLLKVWKLDIPIDGTTT